MKDFLEVIALVMGVYALVGVLFGIYFLVAGAKKMDSLVADSPFKVRFLLFPGAVGLWPILLLKLLRK